MIETYYAGSYWPPRPESADACARRAESFFRQLGRIEPVWQHWYEPGDSFEHARTLPFPADAANFMKLFGQASHQVGGGFEYLLWAGDSRQETSRVDGLCGTSSPRLTPCCVFKPPSQGPLSQRVLTAPVLSAVVRAMAMAWEPEWGLATSHQHQLSLADSGKADIFVGWVMYFSRQRGTLPLLPAPVRVEPVGDKGTLVILTPERFTASNPEHVALATRVHGVLDKAGLLRPLQP
jgi:hypothetical protein